MKQEHGENKRTIEEGKTVNARRSLGKTRGSDE
jgi:hypothetical protein